MALNVVNWSDKQLDELADLLQTGDFSSVASFICQNFLAQGSRVMTEPSETSLIVTVNGTDAGCADISAGVFLHDNLVSQLDSSQTVNILDTSYGSWGTGKVAHGTKNRWSIICVKNDEQAYAAADRWFVDDSVDPNTYSQLSTNTLINKAYYEIVVVHGDDVSGTSYAASNPVIPSGYFVIAEIYVPAGATSILIANIYDTTDTSNATVPNWTSSTRVLRLEFWSTLFGVDHDTSGHHRAGGWHIGTDTVLSTAAELNKLYGTGSAVNQVNLDKLTGGITLAAGDLHTHAGGQQVSILTGVLNSGETIPLPSGYTEAQCKWIISPNTWTPGGGAYNYTMHCYTTGRVVTIYSTAGFGGSVNYMIIGIK